MTSHGSASFLGSIAILLAASLLAFSQASAPLADKSSWTQPRTPDGQPDMQGVWTNATSIPMERPRSLGAKEFYTPEEAQAIAKKGYQGDRAALPEAHYDMSQFGLDPMQARFAPNLRTSLIVGPEGRIPAMTPEAQKRNAELSSKAKGHEFDGPENRTLGERCIMWAQEGPPMLPTTYNNNLEIVQGPGYVAIVSEIIHDVRIVPLDSRPHVSPNIRLWRGDSRGHWEGNTLVVDTTNFSDKTPFHGSSENLHLTERFTRTSKDLIVYQFTLDDPATWVMPWTAELVMGPAPGQIFEYACHEGNYGLANDLSAARAEEKKGAE